MQSSILNRWLGRGSSRTIRNKPYRRQKYSRPVLEQLEERVLLSTLLVNNPLDIAVTGETSLRQAVATANSDAAAGISDTIAFIPGLSYPSQGSNQTISQTIQLTQGVLELSGAGAGVITIDGTSPSMPFTLTGSYPYGVFQVDPGVQAVFTNLNLENGSGSSGNGGAILNSGTLTVSNTTFSNNDSSGSGGAIENTGTLTVSNDTFFNFNFANNNGGAIDNSGALTVTDSTFSNNFATNGGAIANAGTLIVSNSTFTNNESFGGSGGAIYSSAGSVNVTGGSFSNNNARSGGAIENQAVMVVSGTIFSGNSASTSSGAIDNNGTLTVSDATLSNNTANGPGGGIGNAAGTLTITNSTFSSNNANYSYSTGVGGVGGGIYNNSGTLIVTGSTLTGNNAYHGGGIYTETGPLTVSNSTISGNTAYQSGGGLDNNAGTLTLQSTIVAGNTAYSGANPDVSGVITTDNGNNLLGTAVNNTTTIPSPGPNDVFNDNPMLAALGSYGGPTQTLALLPGSPAVGAGAADGVTTDQRGLPRVVSGSVDIGAFQTQSPAVAFTTLGQTFSAGQPATITVQLLDPDGNPASAGVSYSANGTTADGTGTNSLTLVGGAGFAPGQTGQALSLNGVDQYAITPNLASLFANGNGSVTLSLWFNAAGPGVIVDEVGQNAINTGWHDSQIEILSDGTLQVRVWQLPAVALGTVSFNAWHNVVLRYNGATQTLDGFLDGVQATTPVSGARQTPQSYGYGLYYAFGATDTTNLGSGAYFDGLIQNISIFNSAISNAAVQTLYSSPGGVTLTLNSSSTGGSFSYPDGMPISGGQVVLPLGVSSLTFDYTDSQSGTPALTVSAPGFVAASQQEAILPAPISSTPLTSIVVGRTLSSYTTSGIQNGLETITYTVYNESAESLTGVLLTDTLEPGVTLVSASQQPDQSGQNLAWSLGTIEGDYWTSVSVTVSLANSSILRLDTGAQAYATQNAGPISASTPAATLIPGAVGPTLLESTPDANTSDPYIQEEAAALSYNAQNIFNFLQQNIGYNSYYGSLRGARGTLWSDAGNALDVASLGVALMRASGIPAQYVQGTLTYQQAAALILSMFPASDQLLSYVPAGTQTSDPANDSQLQGETQQHYWFQFNTGSGWVNADPLMAGAQIGQTFTTATGTFVEVPQNLRQTTEVSLTAEVYSQAAAAFGSNPFQNTDVLDVTFNDVDLVGRPLTVGNFVTQSALGGLVFTSTTNTYAPYVEIGDEASPDPSQDELINGQSYQEQLTNFPLGSQILTGLFLNVSLGGPGSGSQTYTSTLIDRIGYAARQGLVQPASLAVSPTDPPIISATDLTTMNILPGLQSFGAAQLSQEEASQEIANLSAETPTQAAENRALITAARANLTGFALTSDQESANLERAFSVDAYFDAPRITVFASHVDMNKGDETISFSVDLTHDSIRVIASPGQNVKAAIAFAGARGLYDSFLEAQTIPVAPGGKNLSSAAILQLSLQQGIPLVVITASNLARLQTLNLPADAIARITTNVQNGLTVLVPSQDVMVNGAPTTAWVNVNTTTGEMIAQSPNGGHQDLIEYVLDLVEGAIKAVQAVIRFLQFIAPYVVRAWQALRAFLVSPAGRFVKGALALFIFGESNRSYDLFKDNGLFEIFNIIAAVIGSAAAVDQDPPLPPEIMNLNLPFLGSPATFETQMNVDANETGGAIAGTVQASSVGATGDLTALWASGTTSSLLASSLGATADDVVDSQGTNLGSGTVALAGQALTAVSISGNTQYSVNGQGTLAFYGPAESSLGVSGFWDSYSATVTGSMSITLTVPAGALTINGQPLPAGTYTITTSSATLSGSGLTTSPNFAGSADIAATNGTVNLGPGSGTLSVGGDALDPTNGIAIDGYTGNITVAAGGGGNNPDTVALNGNTTNLLSVSAAPSTLTTDQNTPITFQANFNTSLADSYTVTAQAPAGWTVTIDNSGQVTVTPAPGLQGGTYPIQLLAQSASDPNLVAQCIVNVSVTATQPGLTVNAAPDPTFTVPYNGAQVHTASRVTIQNLGPAADTYNLTFANIPSGFTLASSASSVTVPAGQTGFVGVYLVPITGAALPAPGTTLSFQVTAISATNPDLSQTTTESFAMPVVEAVTIASNPAQVATLPGLPSAATVTLVNVGNVATNAAVSFTTDSGLTVSGLPAVPVAIGVGQSVTETVTLTPGANIPLNTTLTATVSVGPAATQDVLSVLAVSPSLADPVAGETVDVSADVFASVLDPRQADVSYTITDGSGNTLFTSIPAAIDLGALPQAQALDLGTFSTAGLPAGQYTINVAVDETNGQPIAGASGTGTVVVSSPLSATLTLTADSLDPVSSSFPVGNTLTLINQALVGSVQTDGAATTVALDGTLAYVAGTQDINIVDVSNPASPQVVGTFGAGELNGGGLMRVAGNELIVATATANSSNSNSFDLLIYSLANPLNPQLVGTTTIPYVFPSEMVVQGNTVYIPTSGLSFDGNGNISDQFGSFLAVDISNPAAPVLEGVLFNDRGTPDGGDTALHDVVPINSSVAYVVGSSSTGAATQMGNGQVLIVNTGNPANLTVAGTLDILGTVDAQAMAVDGNYALVVGSTGGQLSQFNDPSEVGLAGNVTLTLLNFSNPLQPTVVGSTLVTQYAFPNVALSPAGQVQVVDLGNGHFAVSDIDLNLVPVILGVDASNPSSLVTSTLYLPDPANGLTAVGGNVYVASADGLQVYQAGALFNLAVNAQVVVPSGTAILPDTFSTAPTQIVQGASSQTLIWNLNLAPGASQQITWQTQVNNVQPSQVQQLVSGATIQFTDLGTTEQIALPPQAVGEVPVTQSVAIPVEVVVPGVPAIAGAAVAADQIGNTNLANQLHDLSAALTSLVQTPTSAVYQSEAVAALTSIISLVASDPFLAPYVAGLSAGSAAIASATTATDMDTAVIDLGTALNSLGQAISDEAAYGFTLSLTDPDTVIEPGAPAIYTIEMQNTGTATATYDFSISGLPAGVTAVLSQPSITLASGAQIPNGPTTVTLSLSESGDTLIPADFTITATAEQAPEITRGTPGQIDLRPESLQVGAVVTNPPFTNAGGQVDVTAKVQSVVNEPRQVSVFYTVTDINGNVLFTDTAPVSVSLGITSTLTTVDLGTFDTTGFVNGEDTITVTVTDQSSQPLPSATGAGIVTIGSPVTAILTASPTTLPTGNGTVSNTLDVTSSVPLPAPLTVIGQVATTPATTVALYQDTVDNLSLAYVCGPNGIDTVNVTNPAVPVDLGTFGQSLIVQGGTTIGRVDTINGQDYLLVASTTEVNANSFTLLIYSLATPTNPTLVNGPTGTPVPYEFINDLLAEGSTLLATTEGYDFIFGLFLGQFGTVVSINVSNPAAPVVEGDLFNGQDNTTQYGGVIVNDHIAYIASSTNSGGNTQDGVGRVLVVNFSDPSNLTYTEVDIPGTYQIVDIGLEGNQALVVGRTGGNANAGVNGTMTLSVLDTTDPDNPQLVGTTLVTNAQFAADPPLLSPLGLGNSLFAVSEGSVNGNAELLVVDTSDPNNILVSYVSVPAVLNEMAVSGNLLYATSGQGLTIYQIGQFEAIPVTVSVEVPTNTGVAIVPNSQSASGGFTSSTPQIVQGTNYDTITWSGVLTYGASDAEITWQSTVSHLGADEVRPVTLGASVDFVSQGTPGTVDVPGTSVTGVPIISITPESQTVQPGGTATYDVQLTNPTANQITYVVFPNTTYGDYFSNVQINSSYYDAYITVPAGTTVDVPLQITTPTNAPAGDESFTVEARDANNYYNGADGTTPGDLIVAGPPLLTQQPNPVAYGVVAALTPAEATAGQGTSAQYVVQLTNTGSAQDYFDLQVNGLPNGVYASFGQYNQYEYRDQVAPGAGNFVDVPLTLFVSQGTLTGSYPFTVTATSTGNSSATSTANGTLAVVNQGVSVSLDPFSGNPGDTFQMTVYNTGNVQDTYNLTLGGPAAAVATLGMTTVTLAPGTWQQIPITTGAMNFAVEGALPLYAIATSQTDPDVSAFATASLNIPASQGMTAEFSPASQTLPTPGGTSFELLVNNIGNVQDSYTATIIGTTGTVSANLVGINGQPTQTVPIFYLPGLSTADILLQTNTAGPGGGTVTVVVTSLSNPAITTTVTAITYLGQVAETTTMVTSDHPSGSTYGQTDTFTATISSSETPTGSVQFQIDGSNFGSPVSLVNGMASVSAAALSAGPHTIDAFYISNSSNFYDSDDSATPLSEAISPAALIVTADDQSMNYGDSVPALTYTYTGLVNGDSSAFFTGALATTATSSSSVSSYDITEGTLAATGNYTIGTFNQGTLTVNPAQLIVVADDQSMNYGDSVPDLTFTYYGLVNGDSSASFTGALATTATSSSSVNTYDISAGTLAATGNYTIGTFYDGNLTVHPASLIVTADNQSMTYGGSVPTLTYTYTGLVNGDSSASFTGALDTTATSSSNFGDYPITEGTLAATGNYTIGTFNQGTLTINNGQQAAATTTTVTSDHPSGSTYGQTDTFTATISSSETPTGSVQFQIDGSNFGSPVSLVNGMASVSTAALSAGPYTIDAFYTSDSSNFSNSDDSATPLSEAVSPASLIVTADNKSMTYGGSVPALTYTYTGLVNSDSGASFSGALTTTATSSSSVNSYAISEGSLAATGNYTIGTFNQGTLTVNPALLTVTADNKSMTYGGSVPALTYTYTGLVNSDSSASFSGALTTTATSSSSVSSYAITEGSLAATGNYTIGTFNQGTLTVNPASLIVTAANQSMTYGGSVPALTFTYTGLVNNDSSASFTGALTTTATSSSSVNSYAITEGNLAATGNYTIGTFHAGTLTVSPAPLIVTAANNTMTYGGSVPALTYTYTGLVNNDSSASFTGSLTTTATSSSSVNSYSITEGSLAATGNYTIGTFNQGTLTVDPAPLTVTADNKSMTYGGSVPALTFTYTGLVNSDSSASFTGALATTATSSSPVNTYPITEGSLAATGNYTIGTFHAGTLTVSLPSQAADYILNPTANGALTASGNADVKVPGGLYVDSSSASAVRASGNAQVNAGNPLLVVGGVSTSGNAVATKTGTPSFTGDPLASLAAPGVTGTPVAINLSGHQSQTINPGVYSQIQVSGQASLTMNQGVYVIAGGGFTVSGGGSVINTGTGVTIYNAGSGYAYNPTTGVVSDGGTFGSISLSGNGTINLSAPTSGPYAGVLLFQSRGNSRPLSLSGNGATGLTGTVYAPAAAAGLSGNAQLTGTFIVNTLSVSGNAGAFELVDGASSDYAASTSNWISNGILTVSAEDDTGNGLDPNEIARISDAMTYLNSALSSFGVYLSWAAPGSSADVTIHFATTTPEGGAGDGVMGFTTAANDVYLVTGWNFYTGSDPSAIGAGQYDFLTLATHELAHTVGLGESVDPSSVLYEYLAPGTVRRTFTDSNLSLIDTNTDRFMKAALPTAHVSPGSVRLDSALGAPTAAALSSALNSAVTSAPFGTMPAALADTAGSFGWTPALSAASDSQTNDHPAATAGIDGDGTVLVGEAGNDVVVGGQGQNLMVGSFDRAMAADTTPNHGALEDTVQVGNGSAGTRHAGSDLDWFFAEYAKDNLSYESNDLLRWNS